MGIKLTNNANATLAASINSSATSITLTSGQGARFPTLAGGDHFYATLVDTSNNLEIVKCTARSTDVLTVVRAQESTTARAYTTGDRIEIRLTAQTFLDATSVYDIDSSSTGYFDLPSGTTAQRPGSPTTGMVRHNSSTGKPEWYDSVDVVWRDFSSIGGGIDYAVELLVIAGGGGADNDHGGGGGAGGVLYKETIISASTAYTVTVGGGGAGDSGSNAVQGSNSVFDSHTAIGGGAGSIGNGGAGRPGGSGGGGGGNTSTGRTPGGAGVLGQGNGGGEGGWCASGEPGGGGGGAGAPGGSATHNTSTSTSNAGNGGMGTYAFSGWASATSTGASGYYAGGGGGGSTNGRGGDGGLGGGGAGTTGSTGTNGAANTGGGGGSTGNSGTGGTGGSGIVIVRYSGSQRGTGGTVVSSGGYTYHTFTTSGTYTA